MFIKIYNKNDLVGKNYAVILCDAEDPYEYIASLHEDIVKAKKRLKFLKQQAQRLFFNDISITDYALVDINDQRVKRCFNYEK